MADDRVKVAGVMLSREEAHLVKEMVKVGDSNASMRDRRRTLTLGLISALIMFLLAILGSTRATGWRGTMLGIVGTWLVITCIHIIRRLRSCRNEQLRRAMNQLGHRVCLRCAYEVSTSSRHGDLCPECGAALLPRGSARA